MSKTIVPVMIDVTTTMQPMKGACKLLDVETEDMLAIGGLSPYPVMPPPRAGLFVFMKAGGVPETAGVAPDEDSVVGVGIGVVVAGDVVVGDNDEDDHVVKMQEPVLGLALVIAAEPPKSQLVCTGFLW